MQDCNQTVLLYNGQIYLNRSSTLNQQQPAATAQSSLSTWLLIRGGFIVAIGDSKQPDPPSNPGTGITRVDLKGACVLPGLQDAHIHVQLFGQAMEGLKGISVGHATSVDELKQLLLKEKQKTVPRNGASSGAPHDSWLMAYGYNDEKIQKHLTCKDLDEWISDRPVVLFRHCYHLCVVNTRGLQLLGLMNGFSPEDDTPELQFRYRFFQQELQYACSKANQAGQKSTLERPPMIQIDKESKLPTGILTERCLFALEHILYKHTYSVEQIDRIFARGLFECLRRGLTAVQSNDFYDAWPVYKRLVQSDLVPIRVFFTLPYDEWENATSVGGSGEISDSEEERDEIDIPLPDDICGLVSCHRVKLFADGSLGAKTAALKEPYHRCTHNNRGILIADEEEMFKHIKKSHDAGYRLEIHVIGDLAAQMVLDCMEKAGIKPQDRPILTHCQVLDDVIIQKMVKLGAIANVQPQFVTSDGSWIQDRLGTDRLRHAYAWKTLLKMGVSVAGGSDAPIEIPDPFRGIHSAVFREYQDMKTKEVRVFRPEERLTFTEALQIYTSGAAFAAGEEDRIGLLQVGMKADFVVIDKPVWIPDTMKDDLKTVDVLQVWVDGQRRYVKGDTFETFYQHRERISIEFR